jgi:uncharacterized membrane protein YkvA (DUF1232 family)
MPIFNFFRKRKRKNTVPNMDAQQVNRELPGWYTRWRPQIHDWVKTHADDTLASIVLLVPDLLVLITRLIKDPRVPLIVKGQLLLAAVYVISPFDFLPEAMLGVIGLAEDAGVLALVLYGLKHMRGIDPAILRDNWAGSDDIESIIETLHDRIIKNRDKIIGADIWQKIETMFGRRRGPKKGDVIRNWTRFRRSAT